MDQIVVLEDGKVNIAGEYVDVKKSKYWLELWEDIDDIGM